MNSLYTIGYGTRSIDVFVGLLHTYQIKFLIDIRSRPYSSYKPEFSRDALETRLGKEAIRYVFMGDTLGGLPEDGSCYANGKVDYSIVQEKLFYKHGIARLRTASEKQLRVALMCSEGKPEDCHRSKLVGMTLQEEGIEALHIDERGNLRTQEEVITTLTNGQQSFLNTAFTSRKTYLRPEMENENGTLPKVVTIGVYGYDEARFFSTLQAAQVDTFCDIRMRRGMRGSEYSFVNSTKLQQRLADLNIKYIHLKELAPDESVRDAQRNEDKRLGTAKRARTMLGAAFVDAYREKCLAAFDVSKFLETIGSDARVVALFCVERSPSACHRSLVADYLRTMSGLQVEDILS